MSSRSLNLVQLIGNLTRDPELRYIPQGAAVCSFSIATNRSWMPSEGGERREETEYHRLVAWNKLAELCSQLLSKGRKVYISGRLQTRQWETPDGQTRERTEVVIDDMIILDSRRMTDSTRFDASATASEAKGLPAEVAVPSTGAATHQSVQDTATPQVILSDDDQLEQKKEKKQTKEDEGTDAIDVDDIPF